MPTYLRRELILGTKLARIVCVRERQPNLLAQDLHRLAWHEIILYFFKIMLDAKQYLI